MNLCREISNNNNNQMDGQKANKISEQRNKPKFIEKLNTDNLHKFPLKTEGNYASKTPRVQSNQFSNTMITNSSQPVNNK